MMQRLCIAGWGTVNISLESNDRLINTAIIRPIVEVEHELYRQEDVDTLQISDRPSYII